MNLNALLGKRAAVKPSPTVMQMLLSKKLQYDGPSRTDSLIERKTRHLLHLYLAMERRHGRWIKSYPLLKTCLRKLAKRLASYAVSGLVIDPSQYLEAHKMHFGARLRPTHLLSKRSLRLYNIYIAQRNVRVFSLTADEQDIYTQETIADLAILRGESQASVRRLLRDLDLL